MHPHDEVCRAGAVQLPGKGERRRNPHRPAFPVSYDIPRLLIPRLYHAGNEIPPVVHKGKRRRHRLIQYQGACGIIQHDPRLSPDEGKVENRLPRPLPGVKNRAVGISDGIGGRVHPAAHNDPFPKALENGAVIRHFQIGFLRSGVRDVHAEMPPLLPAPEAGARSRPAGNKHLPAFPGGIDKLCVRIRGILIEAP